MKLIYSPACALTFMCPCCCSNSASWEELINAWAWFKATVIILLWGFRGSSVMWSAVTRSAWLHLALYVSRRRGAEKQTNSDCADRKLVRLQCCWKQWCMLARSRGPAPAFQPIPELHTIGYVTVMWFEKNDFEKREVSGPRDVPAKITVLLLEFLPEYLITELCKQSSQIHLAYKFA